MVVNITAIIYAKAEHIESVKRQAGVLTKLSRTEKSCLIYEVNQGIFEKNVFIFHEAWSDQQGLDQHNQQPYFIEFHDNVRDLLEGEPVIIYSTKIDV